MPPVVLDASAAVELLLRSTAGAEVAERLQGATAAAPAHLDAEVFSALARLSRTGALAEQLVGPALAKLARAPVSRFPIAPLLAEAWTLRSNVAARDALYVVLARRLVATLVTADARLARSPRLEIAVALVA